MRIPTHRSAILSAAAALASCLFLWNLFAAPEAPFRSPVAGRALQYTEPGQALLHGLDAPLGGVSARMPVSSIGAALMFERGGAVRRRSWQMIPAVLLTLFLFCTGALLGGTGGGIVAVLFFHAAMLFGETGAEWTYPQNWYAVLLTLCAGASAWRALSGSLAASSALGAALGTAALFRSPLAGFPFLLLLLDAWRERRLPARGREFVVIAVPVAFLLAWAAFNRAVGGAWAVFEQGPPLNNVITGAAGLVSTVSGDWRLCLPDIPDAGGGVETLRWALTEMLGNPLRTAAAVGGRFRLAFSLHPLLFLLAGLGLWRGRRLAQVRAAAWLGAYFLGVHVLFSVRSDYFVPLWPLLAALAAPLAAAAPERRLRRGAARVLLLSSGAAFLFGVCALIISGRYAILARHRRPDSARALEEAARRAPGEPWVLRRTGDAALGAGDEAAAARSYAAALSARPADPVLGLRLAWALARLGHAGALRNLRPGGDAGDFGSDAFEHAVLGGRLFRFLAGLEPTLGRTLDAAAALVAVPHPDTETDKAALAVLRSGVSHQLLQTATIRWGPLLRPRDRVKLVENLPGLGGPASGLLLLEQAEAADRSGAPRAALRILARLSPGSLRSRDVRRAAALFGRGGDAERAVALLMGILVRHPGDPVLWLEKGEAEAWSGRRIDAVRSIEDARKLGLDPAEQLRAGRALQAAGAYDRAIELLTPLTKTPSIRAEALRDRGVCKGLAGDRAGAKEDLEAALVEDSGLLSAAISLAALLEMEGRFEEAETVYQEAGARAGGRESGPEAAVLRRKLDALRNRGFSR